MIMPAATRRRAQPRAAADRHAGGGRVRRRPATSRSRSASPQGPEHAMNPRELVACAEAAMMTAKARGKNQIVLFDDAFDRAPRRQARRAGRDVRSIAHLKMLQSLAGKLNRLNDVRQIGEVIADELRLLIDYHNCRVSVIEGDEVVPIAFRGELLSRRRRARRPPAHADRRGHHRARRGDRGAAARRQHARVRVRGDDPRHAHDRGVASRGAALLRRARDRRDRDLEARRRPVRRGRRPAARGARRPCLGRARERAPVRGPATRGRPPEGAARVHRRDLAGGHARRDRRGDGPARPRSMLGRQEVRPLAPGRERRLPDQRASRTTTTTRRRRPMLGVALDSRGVREIVGEHAEPFLLGVGRGRHAALRPRPGSPGPSSRSRRCAPTARSRASSPCASRPPTASTRSTRSCACSPASPTRRRSRWSARRSFENLEETFVSTVEALANALEANDEYTSSHTRWITDMALRSARRSASRPPALKRLELGALFHDIGKIGIPTSILLKPGPLIARGAQDHRDAPGARRADPRADRPARRGAHDRPQLPRALGRRRLPGPQGWARRSRSRRGSSSSATRSTR